MRWAVFFPLLIAGLYLSGAVVVAAGVRMRRRTRVRDRLIAGAIWPLLVGHIARGVRDGTWDVEWTS